MSEFHQSQNIDLIVIITMNFACFTFRNQHSLVFLFSDVRDNCDETKLTESLMMGMMTLRLQTAKTQSVGKYKHFKLQKTQML